MARVSAFVLKTFLVLQGLAAPSLPQAKQEDSQAPEWIKSNFTGKPPEYLRTSKRGKIELLSILGSKRFKHSPRVEHFAFSNDGTRAISVSDHSFKTWDFSTGKQIASWRVEFHFINVISLSPDGTRVVVGGSRQLGVWDVGTGKELATLLNLHAPTPTMPVEDLKSNIWNVAFSQDGNTVFSSGTDGRFATWDLKTARKVSGWKKGGEALGISPNGKSVLWVDVEPVVAPPVNPGAGLGPLAGATFTLDEPRRWGEPKKLTGTLRLKDTRTGAAIPGFQEEKVEDVLAWISPDGSRFFLGKGNRVRMLDLGSGKEVATLKGPSDMTFTGIASPDGKLAVWSSGDWAVCDARGEKRFSVNRVNPYAPIVGQFSPDSKQFVSGNGPIFRLWDIESGRELVVNSDPWAGAHAAALSPDGNRLFTAAHMVFRTWDFKTGKSLASSQKGDIGKAKRRSCVALSADGKLALTSFDDEAKLWDMETGSAMATFQAKAIRIGFSADGNRAFFLEDNDKPGPGYTIRLLDVSQQQFVGTWKYSGGSTALSPDGRCAISYSDKEGPQLWNAETGTLLAGWKDPSPTPGPTEGYKPGHLLTQGWNDPCFSPDGKSAITPGQGSFLKPQQSIEVIPGDNRLWEVATGKLVAKWGWNYEKDCTVRAFTPDGKLALLGAPEILVLMDVKTGQELDSIVVDGDLFSLTVSRDLVIAGCSDGTTSVYRISAPEVKVPGGVRNLKAPDAQEQKLPDAVKKAQAKLGGSPEDADANLIVGKYFFQLGKFDEAFPHFAKGSDVALKALAEKELSKDPDATSLGGEWAEASKKNVPLRPAMMDRATFWCAKAWLKADDQEKEKLRQILRKVASPPAGFEKAGNKKTESIDGWNAFSEATSSYIDDLFAHTGKRSAKVLPAGKDAKDGLTWVATLNVPAAAGKVYKASAWFFTEGTDADGSFDFEFSDSDGKRVLGARKPILMDCPFWRKIEVEATAPEGTIRTFVNFWVKSKRGALWVDDVSILLDGKELLKNGGLEGR